MSLTTTQASLKIGDLVKWHSNSWVFSDAKGDYKNPGIVVEKNENSISALSKGRSVERPDSYKVLWSDGRITNEWLCYLQNINTEE